MIYKYIYISYKLEKLRYKYYNVIAIYMQNQPYYAMRFKTLRSIR